jgi:putative endonuclease
MKVYWVYILASKPNGILYTGFTGNLIGCIYKNKQKLSDGFAKQRNLDQLVYMEEFYDINEAIHRKKCIKRWRRAYKIRLIERHNPDWRDLYEGIQ